MNGVRMADVKVMDAVELGFIEQSPSWKLKSKFFRSKVGGKPAWLSLENLPFSEELQCQICKKPLLLLLQIYAPIDNWEEAFHRTLFLFMCTDGKCSQRFSNKNFAVFRSQLARKNNFYDFNPPIEIEEKADVPSAEQFQSLCIVCGCKSTITCEHCLKIDYCSQNHLSLDWEKQHKIICNKETNAKVKTKKKKACLLPEYELVTETEYLPEKPKEKSDDEKMKEYQAFVCSSKCSSDSKNELTDDNLDNLIKKPDKVFNKFQKRIALEPEQVLRYQRGGVPLWVSSDHILTDKDIPNCECGAKRIFEFQVLPQLLNHLSLDSVHDSVDWGALIIYTCSKSCSIGNRYAKEFIWKQDFSDDDNKMK